MRIGYKLVAFICEDDYEDVGLELPHDTLFILAMQAHKLNITLNQYVNKILAEEMARREGEKTNAESVQ